MLKLIWNPEVNNSGTIDGFVDPELTLPPMELLAEFLRAVAPSTDVKGAGATIYGKRGLKINDLYPVGNYALRIAFSDGHDAGIYPYDYLRFLGENKFSEMRQYLQQVRTARRSREPPVKRAKAVKPKPLSSNQG